MKHLHYLQEAGFGIGRVDVLTVSRPKDYTHTFRGGREKHGFIYVIRGRMCDRFSGGEVDALYAAPGELMFIPKGSVYSGTYLEDGTTIRIVQFDVTAGELPEYLARPCKIELPLRSALLTELLQSPEPRGGYHPFYYLACVYELLLRVDEHYARLPKKYRKLEPALREMNEHPEATRPTAHYAALCDMSEATLRRLFHEYTGASPIEYRNTLRLNRAKNMLESGEYNVSEAAYRAGFSNLSFFIRLYKREFGHTPKKE